MLRQIDMKNVLLIINLIFLSGCQTTNFGSDKDWNVSFYSNCQLPKNTLKIVQQNSNQFIRFKLSAGQKGGCNSDRRPRHSAFFWERSELKQNGKLHRNNIYEVTFDVRFISGFKGDRESFFQIHQSDKGCRGRPLIMLKFSNGLLLGDYVVNIKDIIGNWVNFNVILNFVEMSYDIYLDNMLFIENRPFRTTLNSCARPHIKFGIYRPGYYRSDGSLILNNTSIVDFDKIKIKKIE
jgi:hypothetical protein